MIRVFALTVLSCATVLATEWTGWLTDEKCATSGDFIGEQHKRCVSSGQAVVFVNESDKKVYRVENAEKVKDMVGQKVKLSGTQQGDAIRAEVATKIGDD
ncbi:MAG: hypothetical protein ACRD44_06195 [Bryobacteraceae bacterium]